MSLLVKTEHPHIVKMPGVAGGKPVIAGTRISVAFIARLFQAGEDPAEILASYPHLSAAAVYDAISYYLDHQAEINREIADSSPAALAERLGFATRADGRIIFGPA
jgi:uncharacterized protein (DUF433 family)